MPDAPVTLPEEMEKLITSCVCKCMKCRGRSEALRSAIAEISRERDEYRHARDTLALDYAADKALVRSAESRLREVERERNEARRGVAQRTREMDTLCQQRNDWSRKWQQGQSRIRELEEALRLEREDVEEFAARCHRAEPRVVALEEALRKRGTHDPGCYASPHFPLRPCDCSLAKLLSPTSTETDHER